LVVFSRCVAAAGPSPAVSTIVASSLLARCAMVCGPWSSTRLFSNWVTMRRSHSPVATLRRRPKLVVRHAPGAVGPHSLTTASSSVRGSHFVGIGPGPWFSFGAGRGCGRGVYGCTNSVRFRGGRIFSRRFLLRPLLLPLLPLVGLTLLLLLVRSPRKSRALPLPA
jgi:hypothetical protein